MSLVRSVLKAHLKQIFEVCKLVFKHFSNNTCFTARTEKINLHTNFLCEEKASGKRVPGRTETDGKVMMRRRESPWPWEDGEINSVSWKWSEIFFSRYVRPCFHNRKFWKALVLRDAALQWRQWLVNREIIRMSYQKGSQNAYSCSFYKRVTHDKVIFFAVSLRPNASHGLLILEVF